MHARPTRNPVPAPDVITADRPGRSRIALRLALMPLVAVFAWLNAGTTARAQSTQEQADRQLQPVDQAVGDLDPLATSLRRVQAGLRLDGEQTSLFRRPLTPAEQSLTPHQVGYYRLGPGFVARLQRLDYLVPTEDGELALNIAPHVDGRFIEGTPAGVVYELDASAAHRTVDDQATPQQAGPARDQHAAARRQALDGQHVRRIDARIDARVQPRSAATVRDARPAYDADSRAAATGQRPSADAPTQYSHIGRGLTPAQLLALRARLAEQSRQTPAGEPRHAQPPRHAQQHQPATSAANRNQPLAAPAAALSRVRVDPAAAEPTLFDRYQRITPWLPSEAVLTAAPDVSPSTAAGAREN